MNASLVIVTTKISNATAGEEKLNKPSHANSTKTKRGSITESTSKEIKLTIAKRQLLVKQESRCMCVWDCSCHCVDKLETHVDFNVCKKLPYNEEKDAGLLASHRDDIPIIAESVERAQEKYNGQFRNFLTYAMMLIIIMLLLGIFKAILGLFITKVDKWGYTYIQPGRGYSGASRLRRFSVNIFFFIISPFLFWCKCFTPSEEDLLVASTEWHCSVTQEKISIVNDDFKPTGFDDEKCGEILLSQNIVRKSNMGKQNNRLIGGEDEHDMEERLKDLSLAFNDGAFDDEEDEDEEVNTQFVLQALVQSRASLQKLLQDNSSERSFYDTDHEEDNTQSKAAEELIQSLKSAQIVYRTFDKPISNVRMAVGKKYCIQGYFLPSFGSQYEFVSYNPLAQYRSVSANGVVENIRPPLLLCSKEFARIYSNNIDVLNSGDLSVQVPLDVICINISTTVTMASSVAAFAMQQRNRCINGDRKSTSGLGSPYMTQRATIIPISAFPVKNVCAALQEQKDYVEQSSSRESDYACSIELEEDLMDLPDLPDDSNTDITA